MIDSVRHPNTRLTMIAITDTIAISPDEIDERFVRASGPGGQHVNKVSSAVQLRFDLRQSRTLPKDLRQRAEKLAGRSLTREGVIVITADRFRSQERNRADALERLTTLLRQAAVRPKRRRPTRPGIGAVKRRLESKNKRGALKALRRNRPESD